MHDNRKLTDDDLIDRRRERKNPDPRVARSLKSKEPG